MALDPTNGVAVISAASLQQAQRNYVEAAALNKRALTMQLPDSVKRVAFYRWIVGATNTGDCESAARALSEARKSPVYDQLRFVDREASVMARCEYEEARGVALLATHVQMHPDNERFANTLSAIQFDRPENRYHEQGIQISFDAIAAGINDGAIYPNLA